MKSAPKILLIYPEMPHTFWSMQYFLDVIGKKAAYPPLGLMTIAAMLPEEWELKLVDLNVEELTNAHLNWADYGFISAMNVQEISARDVIQRCKEAGVTTVAGGSLFTHEFDRFPEVDHFVLNEAEITLPDFLTDLVSGEAGKVYSTKQFADVHEVPLPRFDLAKMDKYLYAIVQYSRGCPYMCDFCDVTALFGRRPRTKTADQIIAELDWIADNGSQELVLFADDNLIGNKRILKDELLPALIEWRKQRQPSFFFATQLTINLADDEDLMDLLLEAGFRHVFVGVETPEEESLEACRKKQNTRRDLVDNIKYLHQRGFLISAGFIVGFDTDTEDIFNRQRDFIQESGIVMAIVNMLKAPPGTELFDRLKSEGRLIGNFAFSEGETNFIPAMDPDVLHSGFQQLIAEIYKPEPVYQRTLQFLKDYRTPKTTVKVPEKVSISHIAVVLRVVWKLGIAGANRSYFWKLLYWTYRNKPKLLDKAFFYAVIQHQICRLYNDKLRHTRPLSYEHLKPEAKEELPVTR